MSDDYERLVTKVDDLSRAVTGRAADQLSCRAGCASCCQVELTVAFVEARAIEAHLAGLSTAERGRIHARADGPEGRCVMLDDDDLCAIHAARPLVCRTQGLPLLYPPGFVPEEAILLRTGRGEVTVCPLNFRTRAPEAAEIVDAERIDVMLALVNRLDAEREGRAVEERRSLRDLARSLRP